MYHRTAFGFSVQDAGICNYAVIPFPDHGHGTPNMLWNAVYQLKKLLATLGCEYTVCDYIII